MKRIKLTILSLFLFLGLFACSKTNPDLNQEYVGKYTIISMSDGETEYTRDILEFADINYYIELKKDGTLLYDIGNGQEEGAWINGTIKLSKDRIPFTYEDGTITLSDGQSSMTFKK